MCNTLYTVMCTSCNLCLFVSHLAEHTTEESVEVAAEATEQLVNGEITHESRGEQVCII